MIQGAQAMVRCLEAQGITRIYGYPGVAIAPFYDALRDSGIQHVLVRQEQAAGHMASGQARISGKPAVCCTTSGPGATNLITALATAYADSIPVIAITGQVSSDLLGKDVFQEADITGAAESFVKYSYLVRSADDIPRIFKEAFYIASTGRKGPVLIDVPVDVQTEMMTREFAVPRTVSIRGYKPNTRLNKPQLERVVSALNAAEKPLLVTGGGVHLSGAAPQIRRFCEKFNIPLVTTMMGLGTLPKAHPLNFGMLGNNGKPYANLAIRRCDLLLVAGARLADRAIANPENLEKNIPVIHIDIDTAEIGKNVGPMIPLVGDIRKVAAELTKADIRPAGNAWLEELRELKRGCVDRRIFSSRLVDPLRLIRTLSEKMDDNAVYVADVGQNQLWSADSCVLKEGGTFLTTGGMGTMGYAIPCAIGVMMEQPGRQTVAVCGDGAFQMSMNELGTARENGLPLKVVVFRNHVLGLVREYQHNTYGGRYAGIDLGSYPHFESIAQAYDMEYLRLSSNDKLDAGIDRFLASGRPSLLVCDIDAENYTR